MDNLYKLFLSINSTSWVVVLFGIKEEWIIWKFPNWLSAIILLLIPIILSLISLFITLPLSKDSINNCIEIEDANNSFLPTYLGYFFVGLGIEKWQHLIFVYMIILIFTFLAQQQYFNPMFLLFGYHFYHAETKNKTKIFIIARKKLRKAQDIKFNNLRRINDITYIAWREKDEPVNG